MTELAKLIERVESATGPDRILDATIAADVAGLCLHGNWHSEGPDGDRGRVCDDCGADSWGNLGKFGQRLNAPLPAYTASIDAALGLVERVAPIGPGTVHELNHGLARDGEEFWNFRIKHYSSDEEAEPTVYWGTAWTAPLAILLALLRALSARSP